MNFLKAKRNAIDSKGHITNTITITFVAMFVPCVWWVNHPAAVVS